MKIGAASFSAWTSADPEIPRILLQRGFNNYDIYQLDIGQFYKWDNVVIETHRDKGPGLVVKIDTLALIARSA